MHCADGCEMLHEHKYADGGDVPSPSPQPNAYEKAAHSIKDALMGSEEAKAEAPAEQSPPDNNPVSAGMKKAFKTPGYADGGFIAEEKASGYEDMPEEHDHMNMAAEDEDEAMINKIMAQRYSKGGRVANDVGMGASADLKDNQFDDLVLRDDLESSYTGANSGDEIGDDQEDMDRRDMVSMIMKSRRKKDRLPRPA